MPALPAVPNVIRVALEGAQNLGTWANVLHWSYSGPPPTAAQLTTLGTGINAAWASAGLPALQTADTFYSGCVLTDLSTPMTPSVLVAGPSAGTNGEDPLPGSVCVLAKYNIAMRYRGGHPRQYWSFGGDGDLDTGGGNYNNWDSTFVTSAQTGLQAFQTTVDGLAAGATSLVGQVAVRYIADKLPLISPIVMALGPPLVEAAIATQRRRVGR